MIVLQKIAYGGAGEFMASLAIMAIAEQIQILGFRLFAKYGQKIPWFVLGDLFEDTKNLRRPQLTRFDLLQLHFD
jgi:hypothetical protein